MRRIMMVGNAKCVKGGITTVISFLRRHDWKNDGILVKFIPTYISNNNLIEILFYAAAYIRILFTMIIWKPNLVHIHMSYRGSFKRAYYIYKLAKICRIRIIVHLHGSEFKKWYYECNLKTREKITRLITDSNYFVVLGEKWKSFIYDIAPKANIIVARNTVEFPVERAVYDSDKCIFTFTGVLIKRKGVDILLDAISKCMLDKKCQHYKFYIAGVGEEELSLKTKTNDMQLGGSVSFLGWVNDLERKELLCESRALILPSYNEGLPMSILEALSFGVPVIATSVGSIGEAIKNGHNGFMVDAGNSDMLAECIKKIGMMDEKKWGTMSNNSRDVILEKFSSKKYIDTFKSIYLYDLEEKKC